MIDGSEGFFDDQEINTLRNITEKYRKVKELLIYAEEVDNKTTFLPASNELRAAFDHLMRVFAFKFGIKNAKDPRYSHINLEKSFGHVYRAGYDSLDYISVKLTKSILETTEKYSSTTIQAICPKYYRDTKPSLQSYAEEIAIIRSNKDVGETNNEDFDKYIEIVNKIKDYHTEIVKIEGSFAEYERKNKQENYRNVLITIIGTVLATAIAMEIFGSITLFSIESTSSTELSSATNMPSASIFLVILVLAIATCYIYCTKGK